MANSTQLRFVQQRISEARTGIFTQQGDALYKLRPAVVNVLKTDPDGSMWFVVQRPAFYQNKLELNFPAEVSFHGKNAGFHLQIVGTASITDDQHVICNLIAASQINAYEMSSLFLAVKVNMRSAQYFAAPARSWKSAFSTALGGFKSFFTNAAQRRVFTF